MLSWIHRFIVRFVIMFKNKRFLSVFVVCSVILGLIVTVYLSILPKGAFDTRKKASDIKGSTLSFFGPKEVKVGEKFAVDLILNTADDPDFTISAVDAIISYNSKDIPSTCAPRACPAYDLRPDFCKDGKIIYPQGGRVGICDCPLPPICKRAITSQPTSVPPTGPIGFQSARDTLQNQAGLITEANIGLLPEPTLPVQTILLTKVTPGNIFDNYPVYPKDSDFEQKPSPTSEIPGMLPKPPITVAENQIDNTQISPTCPSFPGCQSSLAKFPWYSCWGDSKVICPSLTTIPFQPKPAIYFTPQHTISGVKNYATNEKGYFRGFTGKGIFATLSFTANKVGRAEISLIYRGITATDDTNINGYLKDKPVSYQITQERLLSSPSSLIVEVVPNVSPTPILRPSITPVECQKGLMNFVPDEPCQETTDGFRRAKYECYGNVRGVMGVETSCKTASVWKEEANEICKQYSSCDILPTTGVLPQGNPMPTNTVSPPENIPSTTPPLQMPVRPTETMTPTPPPPTPTPLPSATIKFHLSLEARSSQEINVDLYGLPLPQNETTYSKNRPVKAEIFRLGWATTDKDGYGTVKIHPKFIGQSFYLFLRTTSHLLKTAESYSPLTIYEGINPSCPKNIDVYCTTELKFVEFGTLLAGDIYFDTNGNKDHIINSFDLAELFSLWTLEPITEKGSSEIPRFNFADLNGDGVVNNFDYYLLLKNYGKRANISDLKIIMNPGVSAGLR